ATGGAGWRTAICPPLRYNGGERRRPMPASHRAPLPEQPMNATDFRIEKDSLGEFPVPRDAWYGIQTARAVANFPISGRRPDPDFIIAHIRVKRAAAAANR